MKKPMVVSALGWGYFPLAFLARFPFAMLVVGALTLVVTARDSITLGGATSAVVGIGTAICSPVIGHSADRFGQRVTLSIAAIANSFAIAAFAAVTTSDISVMLVLVAAFFVGATAPQVAPMSRTRLVHAVGQVASPANRLRILNGAMAYESAIDEVVFVFGPVAVGALAVAFSPVVAVLAASLLTLVCVTSFALHPSGRVTSDGAAGGAPIRSIMKPGIVVAALGTFGLGFFFGSTLTSLTAYLDSFGSADSAGLIYGCMGVGSTVMALSVAAFPVSFVLEKRWAMFGAIMLCAAFSFALVGSIPALCFTLVVAGIGIGPTLVTIYSIGSERAPAGAVATTLTILGSGVVLGQSVASAITGVVADAGGASLARWMPLVAASVVCVAAIWNGVLTARERCAAVVGARGDVSERGVLDVTYTR